MLSSWIDIYINVSVPCFEKKYEVLHVCLQSFSASFFLQYHLNANIRGPNASCNDHEIDIQARTPQNNKNSGFEFTD